MYDKHDKNLNCSLKSRELRKKKMITFIITGEYVTRSCEDPKQIYTHPLIIIYISCTNVTRTNYEPEYDSSVNSHLQSP